MLKKSASVRGITASREKRRYMPGLDGLRALSVLAVIAYHLNNSLAPGGLLGVGIFFTLSGYLITDQLITQWQTTRQINLKDFWMKRARRLMPAMFFMLAIIGIWLLVFDRARLFSLQGDFVSVALYFNNWWLIFHNISYFESFGPPSPIGHLWSLAIEEQFYFLWPLILVFVLRFTPRRGQLIMFTLIGAAASVLAMALVYNANMDPSRVYFGTDTRAFALLVGAALAMLWPSHNLPALVTRKSRLMLDIVGGTGLIGILLMIWKTSEYDTSLYVGGLGLFSILSAIVTAVLAHPASLVAKLMSCPPLQWIGMRSYSLYIWHYPVIILTSSSGDIGEVNVFKILMQVFISFLLATLSWKFIEEPFRRGSFKGLWRKIELWPPFKTRFMFVLTITPLLLFAISCSSKLYAVKPLNSPPVIVENAAAFTPTPIVKETPAPTPTPRPSPSPTVMPKEPAATATPKVGEKASITAIGDSVILDAAPFLAKLLPGIIVDGKVGRQMSQAQETVENLKANGKLGKQVIIELGTNGAFTPTQLRELLTSLGDVQQIVLVNTRVPKKWQDTVNSTLKKVASEFPKATIVDWYSASKGKDTFFFNDGVHLNQEGAKYYASLVSEAVLKETS
ncbi:acyltransferase family protein [Paenibacillus sp. LMG 31460]|uniref:Acyltransferase family protein n=1 Tax=Paenibacillus germinis TaxID=2654979 RepID=A0ABX1Z5A6_9BACL|nr:acyltransferase family protein [Paenibacillus germinis]NOU88562.1 acyltransferase family protein [Paenibacillus germinis]